MADAVGSAAPASSGDSGGGDTSAAPESGSESRSEPKQSIPSAQALKNGADRDESESDDDSEGSEGKPKKPKPSKLKIKRGGKELEHTAEELAAMLSDDYDHEIPGADNKPVKMKWADITRHVQLGQGALSKMRAASDVRKHFEGAISWGKQPENIGAFIEQQLGVPDHREWAKGILTTWLKEEAELHDLMTSNPTEYHSRTEKNVADKMKRAQSMEQSRLQDEANRKASQERQQQVNREASEALKAVGLPVNKTTMRIAGEIYKEWADANHQLPFDELARLTKQAHTKEILEYLDSHDDDGLMALLGDDRRKKLRALELKALNQHHGKKKAEASESSSTGQPSSNGKKPKGLTEAEILRALRS